MKVRIEKNIYVRDKYKVKRQAFTAGQEVDVNEYNAVLSTNAIVNPEDLPTAPKPTKRSLAVETKDLAVEAPVIRSEETVKEVEKEVVAEPVEEAKKTPELNTESVAPTEVKDTSPEVKPVKKVVKKVEAKPEDV